MSQQPGTEPDETSAKPKDHQLAPGPARLLVLIAAGLALVIYVLGFAEDLGLGSLLAGPLVLAGGLLAGAAVLPRVGRVLVPAAVAATVGTLLLLQGVTGTTGAPTMMIIALVLSFLLVAAVVAAVLLDAGILTMPARRPSPPPGHQQPGYGAYGQPPGYGAAYGQYPEQGGYGQPGYGGGAPAGYSGYGGAQPGYGQPGQYGPSPAGPSQPGPGYSQPTVSYSQPAYGQPAGSGPNAGGAQPGGWSGGPAPESAGTPSSGHSPASGPAATLPTGSAEADPGGHDQGQVETPDAGGDRDERTRVIRPGELRPPE
ncbi:MAG: DUF5336 domain-containing protein [Pseudonocardia sp.]